MKSPKHALKIGNKSFLEQIVESVANTANISDIFISCSEHQMSDICNSIKSSINAKFVPDLSTHAGAAMAIVDILKKDENIDKNFLVLPVDMPFINSTLISLFLERSVPRGSYYTEHYQFPILIANSQRLSRKLQDNISANSSIRDLIVESNAKSVQLQTPHDSSSYLKNINTPEDYKLWVTNRGQKEHQYGI